MYIGHVGAALAAKRLHTSIGLLTLLVATYTPDWVDSALCLAGLSNQQGMLSHSVPAVLVFSIAGLALYTLNTRDWTAGLLVAGVILSHMVLDWVTGFKPTWPGGPMIGLRLYSHPVLDFMVEGMLIVVGASLYRRTLPSRERAWSDVSVMVGALLLLQLGVDIAHVLFKTLTKC
jgi:hypothetical protein